VSVWTSSHDPARHAVLPAGSLGLILDQALTAADNATAVAAAASATAENLRSEAFHLATTTLSYSKVAAALGMSKQTAVTGTLKKAPWYFPWRHRTPVDLSPFAEATEGWLSEHVMGRHGIPVDAEGKRADNSGREYRISSGGWILIYSPGRWDDNPGRFVLALCPHTTPNKCAADHVILGDFPYQPQDGGTTRPVDASEEKAVATFTKFFGVPSDRSTYPG